VADWSKSWTWFEGEWLEGNPALVGPSSHGLWLGSVAFDGARAFEGVTPDLDLHCARVNRSARALGLAPTHTAEQIRALVAEGLKRFPPDAELYIRPMYWAEEGGFFAVAPLPESTKFCLCIYETPMPDLKGFSITLSSRCRPAPHMAPTDAKAACLYPNSARALTEARDKGFDNALVLDHEGHVAELATANIFMARKGDVLTPVPNGSFLDGITRQRVIALLRGDGVTVREESLSFEDFVAADEIFASGNYTKVSPITRIEDRALQPGPLYSRARELYWAFAHGR
jgi:branched-chain amino acid aminotransferase